MAIGDPYVSTAQLKDRLGLEDFIDDTAITSACAASSKWIESFCNRRRFGFNSAATATALVYRPTMPEAVEVDDISSLTDLVVKVDQGNDGTYETTWTVGTHFQFLPFDALSMSEPLCRIETLSGNSFPCETRPSVEVTARWGWPAVPTVVTEAAYQLSEETFKLKDAPFGVAGVNDFGVLRIGSQTLTRVHEMLRPYIVPGGFA